MSAENRSGQPKEPLLPAIRRASDVLNPEQRRDLRMSLERLRTERIQGENQVLEHPLF